ncbi:MAG: tetratricopeptide (TPR) repeat protein [Gammaproteobacteria bacterium]|jgi:tetratricopeptide (TPR) repeat protein
MKPLPDPLARPIPMAVLLALCFGILASCGSGEGTPPNEPSTKPGTQSSASSRNEDWVDRQRRTRNPELAARLVATAADVEARPGDGLARCEHGWALFQAGRIDDALEELKRAVAMASGEFDPHQRLGVALLRLGQHEQGSDHLERALELNPESTDTHFILGHAYTRLDRPDAALEQFRLTTTAEPRHAEAYYEQALLLLERDPGQATELFERTHGLDPFHAGACSNLARIYRKTEREEEARAMLERHREIALLGDLGVLANPFSVKRFLAEAGFYARQNKGAQALEVLSSGIERHPSEGRLWLLQGELLMAASDLDGARAALERAWDLLPDDPEPALQWIDTFTSADGGAIPAALRARLDDAARRWPSVRERLEGASSR